MGLGNRGPNARSGLAVSLGQQPVRLSGKFLRPAGNALVRSLGLLHVPVRAENIVHVMRPAGIR